MRLNLKSLEEVVRLAQNSQYRNIFEVSLGNISYLKKFSQVELTLFVYPYSLRTSANSFEFLPYEEYVKDIGLDKHSLYSPFNSFTDKFFGVLLGLFITTMFWLFKPDDLVSIQSVVSILAAYAIGKEFWVDLDNGLQDLTHNWRLSWRERTYRYGREDLGTLQRFWQLARKYRYHGEFMLPTQIDFLHQNNSKAVEMLFSHRDLEKLHESSAKVLTVKFVQPDVRAVQSKGFMFGVKLRLNRGFWGMYQNVELFQSLNDKQLGTVSDEGIWQPGKALMKQTVTVGRIKYYQKDGLLPEVELIKN
jgi:hypothetical protein